MKQALSILCIILLLSCTNSDHVKDSQSKIIAVYKKADGTNEVAAMYMIVKKKITTDSSTQQDKITIDTTWVRVVNKPVIDSSGRPKKDSTGKELFTTDYFPIRKDSVNYHIELKDIDSLLKHFVY